MTCIDLADIDAIATQPRLPLIMEMTDAAAHTLNKGLPDVLRQWWHGVFVGYTVAFGLTKDAHDVTFASAFYMASPDYTPDTLLAKLARTPDSLDRNDIAHASGVLYGYKQGSAERHDAVECIVCSRRICLDFDDHVKCECNGSLYFCDQPSSGCFTYFDHSKRCEAFFGDEAR